MDDFTNDTATWLEGALDAGPIVDCELGSLVAAASAWTEDEGELDDLVGALLATGRVRIHVGETQPGLSSCGLADEATRGASLCAVVRPEPALLLRAAG